MKTLYLVHDLSDAGVHKRVAMLQSGGAEITLAGFRRTPDPITSIAGCTAIDFGQTYNGSFIQRIRAVLRIFFFLRSNLSPSLRAKQSNPDAASAAQEEAYHAHGALTGLPRRFAPRNDGRWFDIDLIIARNLEMLAIGTRAKSVPLVYESLDIHRLLLKNTPTGWLLRYLEGRLSKRASLLITSSPAFINDYFHKRSNVTLPALLIENKIHNPPPATTQRPAALPWIIGWFGIIRCRKSLEMLAELVRKSDGNVQVVIRGKPAHDQFDDFHKAIDETPGLQFLGPYENPADLAAIYGAVHFNWAVDMYEENQNSAWLLPNRIYEGGLYGAIPIALGNVETGKFLKQLGIGAILSSTTSKELISFFKRLTPAYYQSLCHAINRLPKETWAYTEQDCKDFVHRLESLTDNPHG